MIHFDDAPSAEDLLPAIERMWTYSSEKIVSIEKQFDFTRGAPVFTIQGQYETRGWTDWTQGFHTDLPFSSMTPQMTRHSWILAGMRQLHTWQRISPISECTTMDSIM